MKGARRTLSVYLLVRIMSSCDFVRKAAAVKFGAHMSISGGLYKAFGHGERAGCDTIQIFSKNQQQWRGKPLSEQDIALFKAEQLRTGFGPLVVHDSYLINLAAPADELWEKSI